MFFSRKNSANSREYQLNPKLDNERYSVCQIFPPNFVTLEWAELQTSGPNYELGRIRASYPSPLPISDTSDSGAYKKGKKLKEKGGR